MLTPKERGSLTNWLLWRKMEEEEIKENHLREAPGLEEGPLEDDPYNNLGTHPIH